MTESVPAATPMAMAWPPRYRVYWEDTDGGGVVYHARYLHFMERARSDWLLAMGFPQQQMRQTHGCVFVVTAAELKFLQPARLEDELDVLVDVEVVRRASMAFEQTIVRVADGLALARGHVEVACVTAESFRPTRIPQALRAATMAWKNSNHSQEQA